MADTKWEDFIAVLRNTKTCSIDCPYYKSCSMVSYAPVCMVKDLVEDDLRRFYNLFILGEEGMRSEIMNKLFTLGKLTSNQDAPAVKTYIEELLKVNKQLYIDKKTVKDEIEDFKIEVTSNGFGKPKIPTIILEDVDDPESLLYSPKLDKIASKA